MAEKTRGHEGAPTVAAEAEPTKAELQRRLEETRDDISETVEEIKETVSNQIEDVREKYETVKDGIAEVLDWREEFAKNPLVWGVATLSVGVLVGVGLARTFDEDEAPARGRRRRKSPAEEWAVTALGGKLIGELSGLGEKVLPAVSGKIKEMFGIDLSSYLPGGDEHEPASKRRAKKPALKPGTKKIGAAKKSAAKKTTKKRGGARKSGAKRAA